MITIGSMFTDARGSALECAAIQDVLAAFDGLDTVSSGELKSKLERFVSMLPRMVMKVDAVSDVPARYDAEVDYEHRFAEHEHRFAKQEYEPPGH